MSTGIETWQADLTAIGQMYPFAGSEMMLAGIVFVAWLGWHIVQLRMEAVEVKDESETLSKPGELQRLLSEED